MIIPGRLQENINIGIKLRISVRRTDFSFAAKIKGRNKKN